MANEIILNHDQLEAIGYPHNKSAIVTAAAGSGKTTLLVQRVIRLLSDVSLDIPADSLAIMTFTRNATKSMREKLNNALNKELDRLAEKDSAEDRQKYDYLKKQMFALRRASISTIDAFCLRIIKENAEAFDLPLNFSISDNAKKAALQSQALKSAMEELYSDIFTEEERDSLFFSFNFEDDQNLEQAILSVSEKLSGFPDPEQWIQDAIDVYSDNSSVEKNFLPLLNNCLELYVHTAELNVKKYRDLNIYDELCEEVESGLKEKKTDSLIKMKDEVLPEIKKYIAFDENRIKALLNDYKIYKETPSTETLSTLLENLENNSVNPPERFGRNGNSLQAKKSFNLISSTIDEQVNKILDIKIDKECENKYISAVQNCVKSFFKLLKIFTECYDIEKNTSGFIDFSDCERLLYNKLSENNGDNEFRRQLSQRFSCIIVDEFQDSNNIQAEIFRLLGEGRLFYVGDVKQSIYSFRGADPYIMADLCDNPDSGFKKLPLNINYRSRKAIIDTVNATFTGLMTPKYGGVDYADRNGLNLGCKLPEPENKELYDSEICFIHGSNEEVAEDEQDNNMVLPRYVANRIKELHDNENFLVADGKDENDNIKYRRADYSDFIILIRTKTKFDCYRKALTELGISSSVPKGSNFFNTDEIKMIYNYLKVIDNPLLDEEMLKVLMSPIYRFTAEEVAQLRIGILGICDLSEEDIRTIAETAKKRSIYSCINDCMKQSARKGKEIIKVKRIISPKLERFYSDLKSFRYYMNSNSLDNLIRKIYEDTDLIAVTAAFEDSVGRVENIRKLQNFAVDFEARGGGSLADFIRFLDRAKENASKGIEEAARPERGTNEVRIMTFHGSKGLEAPVCIISELQYQMNDDDYTGDILISREHFMAMKYTDIKQRRKIKMLPHYGLSRFIRERLLGDELRLLYVAMTRAQEKLIMVSDIGKTNYEKFGDFINNSTTDPAIHDAVYEKKQPFSCVFSSLLRYAPEIDNETKEFRLNSIDCRISAKNSKEITEINNKSVSDNPENDLAETISEKDVAELSDIMKLKYEYINDTVQQAKFTTTELAHKKAAKPISLTKPTFASGGKISGVEKGNAYHHCMQHFPLDRVNADMNYEDILCSVEKAINEMTANKKITNAEKNIIETERIAKFFYSELGKRMLTVFRKNPDNVKREQSFYAEVNGRDVRQDYDGDISIQGQIDMYFIENGEIVVIDYKSDTIDNLAKEQKNYEFQVEIYTKILEKLTGMKIKEMYLYAFLANKEMKI